MESPHGVQLQLRPRAIAGQRLHEQALLVFQSELEHAHIGVLLEGQFAEDKKDNFDAQHQ